MAAGKIRVYFCFIGSDKRHDMKKQGLTFLDYTARGFYILIFVMFSVSFIAIAKWSLSLSGFSAQFPFASMPKYLLASSAPVATSSSNEFQVASLNQDYTKVTISLSMCFLAFVAAFISVPAYSYYRYKKPAQKLAALVMAHSKGEINKINVREIKSLGGLTHAVAGLLTVQQSAETFIENIGKGNFESKLSFSHQDDHFTKLLTNMQSRLLGLTAEERKQRWINENMSSLEKLLKEQNDESQLNRAIITLLRRSISAGVGAMYSFSDKSNDEHFSLLASCGTCDDILSRSRIDAGQGHLGQLAFEKQTVVLTNLPCKYLAIHSGLGESQPATIVLVPLIFKSGIYGAFEFALFRRLEAHEIQWLEKAGESLGAHLFNNKVNREVKEQLQELAAKQAEELVEIHRLQANTYNKLEIKLKEVEEEKAKTESILEGCVDAVITFSERGEVHFCNKAAEELLGRTRSELAASRIFDIIPMRIDFENGALVCNYLSDTAEKVIAIRTEASVKNATGEYQDVLITSTQVSSATGTLFTFFMQKISVDLF